MPNVYLDDDEQAYAREEQARERAEREASERRDCARCRALFGEGGGFARRAKGTDMCLECAWEIDPPSEPRERNAAPIDESPSYREALYDSGRLGWR